MATPIIVVYHGLFMLGEPAQPLPAAIEIVREQMRGIEDCGLLDEASEFHVGINGGLESMELAIQIIPRKARVEFHGLQCRNEIRTMLMIEERLKMIEGEAYVFYSHSKGAMFPPGDKLRATWRHRMFHHVIASWRTCVADLDDGADAVGTNYLTPERYGGLVAHPYFGGNYWAARASYLKTLPSLMDAPAVKQHGIDAQEARFEAESHIGMGPRRPKIKDYSPGWPA